MFELTSTKIIVIIVVIAIIAFVWWYSKNNTGYSFSHNLDSCNCDVEKRFDLANNIPALMEACNKNPKCAGFNNLGYLKSVIKPPVCLNGVAPLNCTTLTHCPCTSDGSCMPEYCGWTQLIHDPTKVTPITGLYVKQ